MSATSWFACALALITTSTCAFADASDVVRFFEGKAASAIIGTAEPRPEGYLANTPLDFRTLLAPSPNPGSLTDRDDVAIFKRHEVPSTSARWAVAQADDASVYDRFSEAFGLPIDREHTPLLVQLLNRVERDVGKPTFDAKEFYQRPRPFQRFQLSKVCGEDPAPRAERNPVGGSSHPSGHAAYGWAAALMLAEVAPDHAKAILARGMDYGESRVVCGAHFPSDVEAGRLIATAVVQRLYMSPEFMRDLRCAQWEHKTTSGESAPPPSEACGRASLAP